MTPQQQKVLAAFQSLSIRTIGGLVLDLNLPRPSIRRCLSALINAGQPITKDEIGFYTYTKPSDAHGV